LLENSFSWTGGEVNADPKAGDGVTVVTHDFKNTIGQRAFKIYLCEICGDITGHTVEYEISHGLADELLLKVCGLCLKDLMGLGFRFNQVLAVPALRVAHCTVENSPFHQNGYVIKMMSKVELMKNERQSMNT
jgi:hypothetical protein